MTKAMEIPIGQHGMKTYPMNKIELSFAIDAE